MQDIGRTGSVEDMIVRIIMERTLSCRDVKMQELEPRVTFNVAIAVEHIVLRALDYGLGTCWVRLIDEEKIRAIFSWDNNISVVALLPLGYPDETPLPRKRLTLEEILL